MNQRVMTRRHVLRYSAASLLAAGLWPGALRAEPRRGTFRFAVLNDLHYLNDRCGPWFEKLVRNVNEQNVELVLIAGDLVEHGTAKQFGAITDILKLFKVPYYVVVGNHDYVTQTDRKAFEQLHPGRINYHFEHQGWQFIGIDTTDGQKSRLVKAPGSTLEWLDATLPKLDAKKPTVLFTHFPLGFGVPVILQNANAVLERFRPFNLQAAYSGHFHGFSEIKHGMVPLTTNKCCSHSRGNHDKSPEKGYFLCQAKDDKVSRTFVEMKL
jgi:predicted MPP superfamily phosphohydrolase